MALLVFIKEILVTGFLVLLFSKLRWPKNSWVRIFLSNFLCFLDFIVLDYWREAAELGLRARLSLEAIAVWGGVQVVILVLFCALTHTIARRRGYALGV
jgi:hypothetical protein